MVSPFPPLRALSGALMLVAGWLLVPAALADFVPGMEDVPLAPGLTAAADEGLLFDAPAGRIVQSTAFGKGDPGPVQHFYAASLPQLGWALAAPGRWTRAGEMLEIKVEGRGGGLRVQFQLSPAQG